jgi:hypothetical protein
MATVSNAPSPWLKSKGSSRSFPYLYEYKDIPKGRLRIQWRDEKEPKSFILFLDGTELGTYRTKDSARSSAEKYELKPSTIPKRHVAPAPLPIPRFL